jgi:hypothetical protein
LGLHLARSGTKTDHRARGAISLADGDELAFNQERVAPARGRAPGALRKQAHGVDAFHQFVGESARSLSPDLELGLRARSILRHLLELRPYSAIELHLVR